ncbi:MAG: hypothetical protein ACLRQF_01735 [Thomasclavelia ramosa]
MNGYVLNIFELLDKSHNPLLRDIFSSLEIYARPVFFVNYEKYINYFNLEYTLKVLHGLQVRY